MRLDDLKALCAMSKSLGIKTLRDLQSTARLFGVKTNAELLEMAETLWDFQRGAGIGLFDIRSDES